MDIIQNYCPAGVIIAVIVTVLGSELLKRLDKKNLFKNYRIIFPLLLATLMAVLLIWGGFISSKEAPFWGAVIFTLAVSCYELICKRFYRDADYAGKD